MKTYNIKGYPKYHVTKYGEVYSNHSGEWRLLPIKKWGNKNLGMVGLELGQDLEN